MAKVKKSLMGTDYVETIPKKTRQGQGKHTNMLLPVVIMLKRGTEDRGGSNYVEFFPKWLK